MRLDNPAFNYDAAGHRYSTVRRADPRIASYIHAALGNASTVLNVGAGAGSYEPEDRYVVAVEPSSVMRNQRLAQGKYPAIDGNADCLPFDDGAFDASMALVTVHHWPDIKKGLEELRRVTAHTLIVMTFDPAALDNFWNVDYFPEVIDVEKKRYPTIDYLRQCLGGNTEIMSVPIPFDCTDGFQEAFYGRPEAFLQKDVRMAQSAWGFIDSDTEARLVAKLADDLNSGKWDELYGEHRKMPFFTGALRLVIAHKK
jgi:SAM-dependent methyltransferase